MALSTVVGASWPWAGCGVDDPRQWVLACEDPAARWLLLTRVLGRAERDPEVRSVRDQVRARPATADLIARLPDWEVGAGFSGHNSPGFAPNILNLLADMGLRAGDDPGIDRLLETMLDHQDSDGRFQSCAPLRGAVHPVWVPCCATHTRSPRCWSGSVEAMTHGCRWPSTGCPLT